MYGPWLFLRARSAGFLVVIAAILAGSLHIVGASLSEVPLRAGDMVVPTHVLGTMAAGFAYLGMRSPGMVEGRSTRLVALRAALVLLNLGVLGVVPILLVGLQPTGALLARNVLFMFALGLLAAVVLPSVHAWVVPFTIAGVMHLFGTSGSSGVAYGWALMHQPPQVVEAWLITLVLVASGVFAYSRWDTTRGPGQSRMSEPWAE